MCRLAYLTKPFKSIHGWLDQMDKSFGGDGVGVAFPGWHKKAVDFPVRDSADLIVKASVPTLWHCRRVSCGPKVDSLCHPFPCAGGWLAHNGHWSAGASAAVIMGDLEGTFLSDTAVFARLVNVLGFKNAVKLHKPSGVWLWMDDANGALSVWKNGGSLWYAPKLKAWGSEPASVGKWHRVRDGWVDAGRKPKLEKPLPLLPPSPQPLLFGGTERFTVDDYWSKIAGKKS